MTRPFLLVLATLWVEVHLLRALEPPRVTPTPVPSCWTTSPEKENKHRVSGQWPRLPERLERARISSPALSLKLCIDSAGAVAKVITLVSSGNPDVDGFYQDATRQWKYRPLKEGGVNVPSAAFVTTTFHLQP